MKRKKSLLLTLLISVGISLLLVACGEEDISLEQEKSLKIGINQLAEHPALDLVREGFKDGIEEFGVNAEIDYKNSQGDLPNTISISQKFVNSEVDLIFAIATSAAQSTKQVAGDIPVLFSAVTDPVEAGLVESFENPGSTITGTSDASPIERQIQLFKDLDPNIKTIGIIFNTGEPNSQVQIKNTTEIAKELGIEVKTVGITNISDMPQAVDSLLKKVDGVYTITDNMVASAINLVAEKANEKGLITIGAEESHVAGGILITDGISYYELGKQTARMAKEILIDGKDISNFSCELAENTSKVFNLETLESLNLDINNKAFENAKELK